MQTRKTPNERAGSEAHAPLRRSLSQRHVQMLAIGGVIGVGLFYGASVSVKLAGPGVLLDFIFCGIIVAIVMRALAELTVERPISGSFSDYARTHLGTRTGFVTAAMWWFYWVATVMSELAAIGKLIQFWLPSVPAFVPGAVALILFVISNLFAVRLFGEVEYWFAILKVLAITVFIIFGILYAVTGWYTHGNVLLVQNLYADGGFLPHGILGVVMALSLVVQAYSGIETLGVEAGETKRPEDTMKKAFRSVSFRIGFFYIGSMFVMLCAFSWVQLSGEPGSPYLLLFAKIGLPIAASLINLVIILSGLSSCNTGLYAGSRMLFSNAKITPLRATNRFAVPHISVLATGLAISMGIVLTYLSPDHVYIWITSASAFASLFTWGVILVTEIVSRARLHKDHLRPKYPMPMWPVLPALGIVFLIGSFVAMVVSPLTRISVFSGVIFLVLVWFCSFFKKFSDERSISS